MEISKKKGMLFAVILCVLAAAVFFLQERSVPKLPVTPETAPVAPGGELMCAADSEEAAKAIAEAYGITLAEYSLGIAVFTTEEDLKAVLARGEALGLPALSPNYLAAVQ